MDTKTPHELFPTTWESICCSNISRNDFPPKTGVYAYFGWTIEQYMNKDFPTLYYIGSSRFIQQRLAQHSIDSKLRWLFVIERRYFETENYIELEKALIGMYSPKYNIQHNYRLKTNG